MERPKFFLPFVLSMALAGSLGMTGCVHHGPPPDDAGYARPHPPVPEPQRPAPAVRPAPKPAPPASVRPAPEHRPPAGQNAVREKKPPRPHKNGSAVRRDDKRPDGQPGTRVKNP